MQIANILFQNKIKLHLLQTVSSLHRPWDVLLVLEQYLLVTLAPALHLKIKHREIKGYYFMYIYRLPSPVLR